MPKDKEETVPTENETTETQDATPVADPFEYSAADALKELHQENEPEDEEVVNKDDEDESEDETEEQESNGDEAEESEEDYDIPELSDKMLDPDVTPEEKKKLWGQKWKGILKRERNIDDFNEGVRGLTASPEAAREGILAFAQNIAAHHGISVEALLGTAQQEEYTDGELPDGFLSQKEIEHDRKLKALEAEMKAYRESQVAATRKAELDAFVEKLAPKVIKAIAETQSGFKVTTEMIHKAVQAFPNDKDATEAIGKLYWKQISEHNRKAAVSRANERGPELIPKGGSRGFAQVAPEQYTAAHALQELAARGKK